MRTPAQAQSWLIMSLWLVRKLRIIPVIVQYSTEGALCIYVSIYQLSSSFMLRFSQYYVRLVWWPVFILNNHETHFHTKSLYLTNFGLDRQDVSCTKWLLRVDRRIKGIKSMLTWSILCPVSFTNCDLHLHQTHSILFGPLLSNKNTSAATLSWW